MKLTIEQHPELAKLSQYFVKIEEIAEKMGLEVDDLIQEFKNNNTAVYANFKKSILAIAQKRQVVFKDKDRGRDSEEASIINLNVIVNEERFNLISKQ